MPIVRPALGLLDGAWNALWPGELSLSSQQRAFAFVNRALLGFPIQLQLVDGLAAQGLFKLGLVGVGRVVTLRRIPQVRLENPRRTHWQKILVYQWLHVHMTG